MPRFMGIDYGTKRIGLAVGDTDAGVASPAETIDARAGVTDQVRAVGSAAREYQVDAFVIGLPLNMDGTEGDQAKVTREFGEALARTTGRPVHYWDERLSSRSARELLQPAGLTHKKRRAVEDSIAAQVILQGFLDAPSDGEDKGTERAAEQ
ncbi:MAG: Holliday junction resolvase RuvX [Phycisphaerales bacterium]|nr:MAG: Holliday junction resolvase RuvX [Phycisphaerales bacterium]